MRNPPSHRGKADRKRTGKRGYSPQKASTSYWSRLCSHDSGRDLLERSVEDHVRGLESLLALLSPDEREQLSALLARLPHSMAALRN